VPASANRLRVDTSPGHDNRGGNDARRAEARLADVGGSPDGRPDRGAYQLPPLQPPPDTVAVQERVETPVVGSLVILNLLVDFDVASTL
jgi:hypothetical protein